MSKRYFTKELVDQKVYTDKKFPIPFASVDGDIGILETEDEYLISQCLRLINLGRGGIAEVTQEVFDGLKKKIGSQQSGQRWQNQALSGKDLPNPLAQIGVKGADVSFAVGAGNKAQKKMESVVAETPQITIPDMTAFKPKRGRKAQPK